MNVIESARSAIGCSSSCLLNSKFQVVLSKLSRKPRSGGRISESEKSRDHADFEATAEAAEQRVREQAVKVKRIEIELGIFKPDPEILKR